MNQRHVRGRRVGRPARALVGAWGGLVGLGGLGLAAAGGCAATVCAGCSISTVSDERTFTVPHVAGTAIDVKARNGGVTITKTPGDTVSIHATVRAQTMERLQAVTVVVERGPSGQLQVHAEPPGGEWKSSEGAGFEIKIPDATGVTVAANNGRIEIEGLAGAADLDTSNGHITVRDQSGEVRARTSNGRVTVEHPGGAVTARSSNGRITVVGAPGAVDVDTSNGAVEISLAAESAGPVQVDTSNGGVTLDVGPGFAGELSLSTSNGRITLPETAEGARPFVKSLSKHDAVLMFGENGKSWRSVVSTSNGSVKLRVQ